MGGLSPETTEEDLRAYFQNNYGKVKGLKVIGKKQFVKVHYILAFGVCIVVLHPSTPTNYG